MKHNLSFLSAFLGLASLTLLASCQDEDFGYTEQQIKTSKFTKNFEAEYGPIDPNQSWDLTTFKYRTAKYDDEALVDYVLNSGMTRADGDFNPISNDLPTGIELDDQGFYHVQPNTIKWLRNYLKEGKNNTELGSAFSLRAPGNKIAIIPIYQGFANMDWSLYIRRNNDDKLLWSESQNIEVSNDGGANWSEKGTTYGTSQTVYDLEIKSKPIVIDLKEGDNFNLYLKIDNNNGQDNYATTGTIQLSSMGMMLALPCPIPNNLGLTNETNNLAMIVGCEDSNLSGSDWDMNDVCFLIVGMPALPNRIDITRKRYMCEDLGNTYDFDFNDIVVDVMEVITSEYNSAKNNFEQKGDATQIATIKHVCGTLPFKVQVGNTWFNEVTDPTSEEQTIKDLTNGIESSQIVNLPTRGVNWNPEFSMKVLGWDHNANNIKILVSTENNKNIDILTDAFGDKDGDVTIDGDKHIYKITFADRGEAPLIIATDPTLMWKDEHEHIPEAWWKEGTFKPTGSADNDAPIDGGHGDSQNWATIPDHLVTPDADGNVVIWEASNDFEGMFNWQNSVPLQTNFLDAAFEGYTIFELIVDPEKNKAGDFYFRKVGQDWGESVIPGHENYSIVDNKFIYKFDSDVLTKYPLGVAIAKAGWDVFYPTKIIMRKPQSYTLTVNNSENGTVTVSPAANTDGKYAEGTEITLTATPAEGWFFDSWSDGNKSRIRTITISGDMTLTPSYTNVNPYVQEEGNIELSRSELTLSNWNNSIDINRNDFHEGDVIVIKVKSYGSNAVIGIKADWDAITDNFSQVEGDIAYTLTSANAQAINNKNKLRIQGNDVTISSVTKRCSHTEPEPEEPSKPTQGSYTFNSEDLSFDLDDWSWHIDIANTNFNNDQIKNGDVIKVTFAKDGGNAALKDLNSWKELDGQQKNFNTNPATITLTVNDNNRQKLIDYGMAIQGERVTFVKAELIPSSSTDPDPEEQEPSDATEPSEETVLTLTDGHTLLISNLEAAEAKDTDIVRFYVSTTENSREGWGIGGFANSDNWTPAEQWKGKTGQSWTYEYPVSKIKEVAGTNPGESHGVGITINIYNECKVEKVTLVKSN